MNILEKLNPAQRKAVETVQGPVLILAGPGSGKTRVITHRVAYLVTVCGVQPYRIMAVTFTNKAAREMGARLNELVSSAAGRLTLGTFHAICARILRENGQAIGIESNFVIYDDDDQLAIIKRALKALDLDAKQFAPRALLSAISAAKSQMISVEEYRSQSYFEEVVRRVYEQYEKLLTESKAVDFDDLLGKVVLLFRTHPEVLEKYRKRYVHVLVDEFQDTNLVQYELVKLIAAKHRNICVVGDPDQSIYSWRSADLRNILNFENDYPDATVVLLEQNYRSTPVILEAASEVIAANQQRKQKGLWTEYKGGELITLSETYTEQEEAQFVVQEIDRLSRSGEASPGECAVMYRTNAQSRALEEAFIRYGVPYKLVAGTKFYERREVKDLIAYLRLVQNPSDSVSMSRVINVPARGIGQRSVVELTNWAQSLNVSLYDALQLLPTLEDGEHPFASRTRKALVAFAGLMKELVENGQKLDIVELFDLMTRETGYQGFIMGMQDAEERWDNVMELRTVAYQFRELPAPQGLAALLENVSLVSDIDGLVEGGEAVTLITLHQAKGLEFPVVFMVGMEEGILPHNRSMDDPGQLEEERRLCYVGMTRAMRRLYMVRSFRRTMMGGTSTNLPSRFLKDIPGHLITGGGIYQSAGQTSQQTLYAWKGKGRNGGATPDVAGVVSEMNELKTGDRVRHQQFGEGLVVNCKMVDGDSQVTVAFENAGVKRLLLSYAKLEKVSK